ncbi:MAG: cytidylyltransferase domain-containing protein [Candidatus Izemoplasmataceae bacterium]
MKIGAIIQARMGSTRLPGKVLLDLKGKTVLNHVIERVKQSKLIDEIIIATTTNDRDTPIIDEALRCGVKVFRGSEDDVLSRYYYAAEENKLDVIIRITSDCPLIDPIILDNIIQVYLDNNYDIVSNAGTLQETRTFPRGLDTEVFSFEKLSEAFNKANETYQREHVTPYIYENSRNVYYYKNKVDFSSYRLTLDTKEDFILISKIYNTFYKDSHNFYLRDIVQLLDSNPELLKINLHINQKKMK